MLHVNWTQVLTMPWVVPVIFGCLVGMVGIVAKRVTRCITRVAETNLKRSMVERGFSAVEIERVLWASAERTGDESAPGKPIAPRKDYA